MNIPTGDYQVEFVNHKCEVVDGGVFQTALYEEAFNRANAMAPIFGGCQWRIMKCMHNSTDQIKDRW